MRQVLFIPFCAFLAAPALAEDPRVIDASAQKAGTLWNVTVTLEHPDTGWDHYASGWEVLDSAGNRLAYRDLGHPHADEQPLTRSLQGVAIPEGTTEIFIRPHCVPDGPSKTTRRIRLGR